MISFQYITKCLNYFREMQKPTLLAIADGWWFNSNHIWKDVYSDDDNLDDVNIHTVVEIEIGEK